MLIEKKNTLHVTHPSLLPLRMTLILAERDVPPSPPLPDVNEQLALKLIEKVQTHYKRPHPFLTWSDIPSQHGFRESLQQMAATHA